MHERGTKRTCPNCASRFYDLARTPAVCPKCGTEYVEPVRPASVYQPRKRGGFGLRSPVQPLEADNGPESAGHEHPADEEREPDEEREEELDGEAGPHFEEEEGAE